MLRSGINFCFISCISSQQKLSKHKATSIIFHMFQFCENTHMVRFAFYINRSHKYLPNRMFGI